MFVKSLFGGSLLRNSALNLVGQAIPLVVGIVALPFLIRGLGTERFGVFSIALIALGYFGVCDLGLGRAITASVAEHLARNSADDIPPLVWTSAMVQAIVGVFAALAFAALAPFLTDAMFNAPGPLRGETERACRLLALSIPLVAVSTSFRGLLEGVQRFDLVNAVTTPTAVATFVLPCLGLLAGLALPGIVALLVILRVVGLLVLAAASVMAFPALKTAIGFRPSTIRPLLSFGGWITISSIAGALLVYSDRIIIASVLSVGLVAYYTAPWELVTRVWIIPSSLVVALFPAMTALHHVNERRRLRSLFVDAVKCLTLVLVPLVVALVVFARQILDIWLGPDFASQSTTVLRLLAVGVLVNSLAQVPHLTLQASGRPDIPAKFHLLEVPLYWFTAWWLISDLGIVGAAWAWLLRVCLDALLLWLASAGVGRLAVRTS